MCASCPQACITPFTWLRNGSSPVSSIGSASMSAAQRHDTAGLAAAQHADGSGLRDRVAHLDPERAQPLGDEAARLLLAVAELGLLVELPARRDHGRRQALGGGADLGVGRRPCGCRGQER